MKQSEAKEFWPIIKAWSEGKTLQLKGAYGFSDIKFENVNFDSSPSIYRIAPEPKLRAWKPEEVPVGALYKWYGHVSVILAVCGGFLKFINREGLIDGNLLDAGCLSRESSHSLDHGKTWLPCGVEE